MEINIMLSTPNTISRKVSVNRAIQVSDIKKISMLFISKVNEPPIVVKKQAYKAIYLLTQVIISVGVFFWTKQQTGNFSTPYAPPSQSNLERGDKIPYI